MGASAWSAKVAYDKDLGAALERARQEAYDRGDYYRQEPDLVARAMTEEAYVAQELQNNAPPEEVFQGMREMGMDDWELDDGMFRDAWRAAHIEVVGPDTLLRSQPFSGTHSVIDMVGVADEPDYDMVAPMPADVLDRVFGTRQPSEQAVQAAIDQDAIGGFSRGQGAYVIAYKGDTPDAVFFVGHSGD